MSSQARINCLYIYPQLQKQILQSLAEVTHIVVRGSDNRQVSHPLAQYWFSYQEPCEFNQFPK
jgi:hypothetical protein